MAQPDRFNEQYSPFSQTCLPGLVPDNVLLQKKTQELKTSKWESDHYLAFTRLSLFHFGPLDTGMMNLSDETRKNRFAAIKRLRVVWFCLMSSILTDQDVDTSRIDDLVKMFLSSCRELWSLSKEKLSGGECDEVDGADPPIPKEIELSSHA